MELFDHDCRTAVGDSHLHNLLHHIIHLQEKIMSTQPTITDLDNAIGSVESAVSKLGTDLQNALNDLIAKVSAAPPQTFDPAPEIARLQAVATKLASFDTTAVADDPGAPAPPPPPTLTATTTTLTAVEPITAGTPIDFTGTVVGGATPPTGTVVITDPTNVVSLTASLDSTGAFTATLTAGLPAGSYSLTAAYSGDAANEPSSGSLSITVTAAAE
jgi:Bacterial Ig-like domain (group 3)